MAEQSTLDAPRFCRILNEALFLRALSADNDIFPMPFTALPVRIDQCTVLAGILKHVRLDPGVRD